MDDFISRLAAITLPIMPKEYRKHKPIDCDDAYEQGWSDCQSCIGRLPTAKPNATLMKVEVGVDKERLKKAMEEMELTLMPAEPRKGKWIPVTNGRGGHECDQCHEYAPSWQTGEERLTNYCPNCGADMRGE